MQPGYPGRFRAVEPVGGGFWDENWERTQLQIIVYRIRLVNSGPLSG